MASKSILAQILSLDPLLDHQRIVYLTTCFEFPFDTTRSLEFALFRTFCVPSISKLLDQTGEFFARAQKRYDDTDLIVSALMEWGYDSEKGKIALRRMNQIHGRFSIANEDFLYVLSTFVFEPIRWNARYGWRLMCRNEKLAQFFFWREVGRRMNLKNLPNDFDEFESFNRDYERAHYQFTESNSRVGSATRDMFLSWFPRLVHPLARPAMYALMDQPVRHAFGFPTPPRWIESLVTGCMSIRARLLRFFPERKTPRLRTLMTHRTYPHGYQLEKLGPPVAG